MGSLFPARAAGGYDARASGRRLVVGVDGAGRPFVAAANVGVFPEPRNPAIVPDVFLSLDVQVPADLQPKAHRSYFVWEFGKPPDLVIEIVSNQKGGEAVDKRHKYAGMGVSYYVIYDPLRQVLPEELVIYRLRGMAYERQASPRLPSLGLGLTLWDGVFESAPGTWLRWTDAHGVLIPTGQERAEQERQRADRLEALLRRSGIDPEPS